MASFLPIIHSHWNHNFGDLQLSTQEFYKSVEDAVSKRKIPDVSFKRITLFEKNLLSAKREYLRISRKKYSYDICAAPFGTEFFVSYWFGEKVGFWRDLFSRIPIIGQFLAKASALKTYFQVDTQNMFNGAVHSSVMEAVDEISKAKGMRGLSELERRPVDKSH